MHVITFKIPMMQLHNISYLPVTRKTKPHRDTITKLT